MEFALENLFLKIINLFLKAEIESEGLTVGVFTAFSSWSGAYFFTLFKKTADSVAFLGPSIRIVPQNSYITALSCILKGGKMFQDENIKHWILIHTFGDS